MAALVPAFPCPHLSAWVAGKRRKKNMKMSRRLTVALLQKRALGVVADMPYVIRYMVSFNHVYNLCFVIL